MQVLKQRFARKLSPELRRTERPNQNRLWQETLEAGHVWQRRFPFVVRSHDKKFEKLKYIHGNPVKRGLVLGAGKRTASGGAEDAGTANLPSATSRAAHPLKTTKGGAASIWGGAKGGSACLLLLVDVNLFVIVCVLNESSTFSRQCPRIDDGLKSRDNDSGVRDFYIQRGLNDKH